MDEPVEVPEVKGPDPDRAIVRYLYFAGAAIVLMAAAIIYLLIGQSHASAAIAHQVAVNQAAADQRWCSTLELLTAAPVTQPADPAANPSRESSYLLYRNFVTLEVQFHCRAR